MLKVFYKFVKKFISRNHTTYELSSLNKEKMLIAIQKIESTIQSINTIDPITFEDHISSCRTMIWNFKAKYPLEKTIHKMLWKTYKKKLNEILQVN